MAHPVHFHVERAERYSRLTTLFRFVIVIPWVLFGLGYTIVSNFVLLWVWGNILLTGTCPRNSYDWLTRYLRYTARGDVFGALMTDQFPPFHGREAPGFRMELDFEEPEARNRLTTALRVPPLLQNLARLSPLFAVVFGLPSLFVLPAGIVLAGLAFFGLLVTLVVWFAILITGSYPVALFEVMETPIRY